MYVTLEWSQEVPSGSPKVHEIRHNAIIDKVMSYTKRNNMSVLEMKYQVLESISEVEIAEWMVEDGDYVKRSNYCRS